MARRSSTIPQYRRRRQRSLPRRILGWIVKLVLAFVLISLLWVLAYRFINPPITATMLGDIFAGNGAKRDWMPIEEIDRDGSELWRRVAGGPGNDATHGLALLPDGRIVHAGYGPSWGGRDNDVSLMV